MRQSLTLQEMNEMLMDVSRTFALSIKNLPDNLQRAMALFYLLLRVSDYLEDSWHISRDEKIQLLLTWAKVLKSETNPKIISEKIPQNDTSKDAFVAKRCGDIIISMQSLQSQTRNLIIDSVYQTTLGMARWQEFGTLFITEADLDDYMFEVAGRVGLTATKIFSQHSKSISLIENKLMLLSRDTGLGLQTVNVIRGLRKDYDRGWIYVPKVFCDIANIEPINLFNPKYQAQSLLVVDMLINKAESHLQSASSYIKLVPWWLHAIRLSCIWPLLFAVRTLALSRHNANVLIGEVKMTRDEVKAIVRDTTLFGWSNLWLERYVNQLKIVPPPTPPTTTLLAPLGK